MAQRAVKRRLTADRRLAVVHVRHASPLMAVPTAAGPERLLEAGLLGRLDAAGSEVELRPLDPPAGIANPIAEAFAACDLLARRVREALDAGRRAVVLSGSCHAGLGAVSGLPPGRRGVVWLDAHGDFNTPDTTGSGLLDGTVLAAMTGRGWDELCAGVEGFGPVADEVTLLVAARELDPAEARLLEDSGVRRLSVEDVREGRSAAVLEELGRRAEAVYVHLDLDALDPSEGRANRHATAGGLLREELVGFIRLVVRSAPARVLTVASYDPAADGDGRAGEVALEAIEAFAAAGTARAGNFGSGSREPER